MLSGFLGTSLHAQTTLVEESFSYADGAIDTVGTGGTGWDATEGGWQTGNSAPAANRFEVISEVALYQGGGDGTYTEQNRSFATAAAPTLTEALELSFTLLRPEGQSGRGVGIYLTNGGLNQFFIGKEVNGSVGLHDAMQIGSTTYQTFSTAPATQSIVVTIKYDGTDSTIILSDSDETLAAHTVPGLFSFDGISLAGYNGATTTNGIDDLLLVSEPVPDPLLEVEDLYVFTGNGTAQSYSIPITNLGPTQSLNITSVTAVGFDSADVTAGPTAIPTTLGPLGGSNTGTIDFTFTPSFGPATYTFDLEINSNDLGAASPFLVRVDIEVSDPVISVATPTLDFGAFANNPAAQTQTFTIDNEGGTQDLEISELNLTGPGAEVFTITSPASLPFTIPPGDSQEIEITFDPGTRPGTFDVALEIISDDWNGTTPVVELSASTGFSENLVADYTFGDGGALDLTSSDAAVGSTAGDLVETDAGARTEFGSLKNDGLVDGGAFAWSRREAPNTGLDLTLDAPTEALSFTLTPAPGATVDLSTEGWLTVEIGAFSTLSGSTSYDVALAVDDGVSPFVLGPVAGAAVTGPGEEKLIVAFDVRSLGSIADPVSFSVLPQTTGNTNGVTGQAAGYLDRITLAGTETVASTPALVVNAGESFTNDGLPDSYFFTTGNAGMAQLDISSIATDGSGEASAFSNILFDASLAPNGGSGFVDFDFTPSGPGTYTTNFVITSNDPGSPTTVAVSVEVLDPEILAVTTPLDFGTFAPSPGQQTLTISVTNDGEAADLEITGTNLTGDGAAAFSVISTPDPIAPGESADITVAFDPGAAEGQFIATLEILSNDSAGAAPTVVLSGYVQPSTPGAIVVARYDFDAPYVTEGAVSIDIDSSLSTPWSTSDLLDQATGTGALSAGNRDGANRSLSSGPTGSLVLFSCNRESDAQTPLAAGGNDESTWTTASISPAPGGTIDYTGGALTIDTFATTSLGGASADWSAYYSIDGGSSWTLLDTFVGASSSGGLSEATPLSWDLSALGVQAGEIVFALDPVTTSGSNGNVFQRGIGFDNFEITATALGTATPGFGTWAATFGIPNDPDYDAADADGISALVEYALGLSPLVAEASPGTLENGVLSFTKGAEAVANGDISYAIEESTDLGIADAWETVTPDTNDPTTISYTLPAGLNAIFARLLITQNP